MEATEVMDGSNLHQRVLKLRDVALGSRKSVSVGSPLAAASYEAVADSLLALHAECTRAGLAKDKHAARFLQKYEGTVRDLTELRLSADDFEVKSTIGRGHFGEVQVVKERSTGDVFAMKVMKKAHILQEADAAFFSEERDIMAWSNSQWLTALHYAFQDSERLYLVMDFHPGGDLLTIIERQEGGMGEEDARFYLAEICAGLADLHRLGFVHRDVKPENVLITRSGHIKLVDFGSAARLDGRGKVTESRLPVGTPEYIAPEVLTSLDKAAEYGVCCDWWSLGVIAYELVYDVTPFEADSTARTYGNIMNFKKTLSFPSDSVEISSELKDLVKKLLADPKSRLECDAVRSHPFFSITNWTNLSAAVPPYIPTVSSADDVSNFDSFGPKKDDRYATVVSRERGFSGRSLPFVGFTYTRFGSPSLDGTDDGSQVVNGDAPALCSTDELGCLRSALEGTQRELTEIRQKKTLLEKECIVYQSQLEDQHRRLEVALSERRHSDSGALKLLGELKEQSRIAEELRETAAREEKNDVELVVEQLEKDRLVASRRARRLHEELKATQQERDIVVKKLTDLKAKLSQSKEVWRKDVTALQKKLTQVTQDSLAKSSDLQDRLLEARGSYVETVQKLKTAEEAAKRLEEKAEQSSLSRVRSEDSQKKVKDLMTMIKTQEQEIGRLQSEYQSMDETVKELEGKLDEAGSQNQKLEAEEWKLRKELKDAQAEVARQTHRREEEEGEREALSEELQRKMQQLEEREELLKKLQARRQSLEGRLEELESAQAVAESTSLDESYKALQQRVASLEERNRELTNELSSTRSWASAKGREIESSQSRSSKLEKRMKELESNYSEELSSLRTKLSETTNLALEQGERLTEVRKAKRELDKEHTMLKAQLNGARDQLSRVEKEKGDLAQQLEDLDAAKRKLANLKEDIKTLSAASDEMRQNVSTADDERKTLAQQKKDAESGLRDAKRHLEAQELSAALLQRSVKTLEDELAECRATTAEATAQEAMWNAAKCNVENDLEVAEVRLEEAYSVVETEKNARILAEQQLDTLRQSMEKTMEEQVGEMGALKEQLEVQQQLALKYSEQVSELEKAVKLKELSIRDTERELDTEKAVTTKIYDELHTLRQEHGKLRAASMKLKSEATRAEKELADVAAERSHVMEIQRDSEEARLLHETRMQATISQQTKLIDYLRSASSPPAKSKFRLKKGFGKFSRKSRDPAKEMAEWNKLKGLTRQSKGFSVGSAVQGSATSQRRVTRASQPSSSSAIPSTCDPLELSFGGLDSSGGGDSAVEKEMEKNKDELGGSDAASMEGVVQFFSVALPKDHFEVSPRSEAQVGLSASKRVCTVDLERRTLQETISPGNITGRKRSSSAAAVGKGSAEIPGQQFAGTIEHNIPHKFDRLRSAPLHKTYRCIACTNKFKPMQKFVKCSSCHMVAHPDCSSSLPNNCGLPPQLAHHTLSRRQATENDPSLSGTTPSAGTRSKSLAGRREEPDVGSVGVATPGPLPSSSSRGGEATLPPTKKPRMLATSTRGDREALSDGDLEAASAEDNIDGVIKMEKVSVVKGEQMIEGWLVLTECALRFHDRNPTSHTSRPKYSFSFGSESSAFVVIPIVDRSFVPTYKSASKLHLAFGVENHCSSRVETAVFFLPSIESKLGWVAKIREVLENHSQTTPTSTPVKRETRSGSSRSRELKSVSLVQLRSPVRSLTPRGEVKKETHLMDSPSSVI